MAMRSDYQNGSKTSKIRKTALNGVNGVKSAPSAESPSPTVFLNTPESLNPPLRAAVRERIRVDQNTKITVRARTHWQLRQSNSPRVPHFQTEIAASRGYSACSCLIERRETGSLGLPPALLFFAVCPSSVRSEGACSMSAGTVTFYSRSLVTHLMDCLGGKIDLYPFSWPPWP